MSLWKALGLVLILGLVAVSASGCCGCPTQLLSSTTFTAGEFSDIPAYPGAQQLTGSDTTLGLATAPFKLLTQEAEWKHYTTSDSASTVTSWYDGEMSSLGWLSATDMTGGTPLPTSDGLFFTRVDDPQVMAVIMVVADPQGGSQRHILIGRLRVKTGN